MTGGAAFGDPQIIRLLAGLAVLLFLGRAVLPRGRGRRDWARWARWGSIAAFAAAAGYALVLTVQWALATG